MSARRSELTGGPLLDAVDPSGQLHQSLDALRRAAGRLCSSAASSQVAMLFLNIELRLQLCTPAAAELLCLLPSDVGRSIDAFASRLGDKTLRADCRKALRGIEVRPRLLHINHSHIAVDLTADQASDRTTDLVPDH